MNTSNITKLTIKITIENFNGTEETFSGKITDLFKLVKVGDEEKYVLSSPNFLCIVEKDEEEEDDDHA